MTAKRLALVLVYANPPWIGFDRGSWIGKRLTARGFTLDVEGRST